jgi:hypothetical protein
MITIFLGKPLVFWLGLLALLFFFLQIVTGVMMTVGKRYEFLKYHKINVAILIILVLIHAILGLLLYF